MYGLLTRSQGRFPRGPRRFLSFHPPSALLAALVVLCGRAPAAREYPEPDDATVLFYFCPRAAQPPVLDGMLDDACWRAAPVVTDFGRIHIGEGVARKQTAAYMVYDDSALYVAFRATEPEIAKLTLKHGRDGRIFKGDSVEIYLRPDLSDVTRYQLVTNAAGQQWDAWIIGAARRDKPDALWGADSGWQAAGSVGEDEWTAEVRLPFADFGVEPRAGTTLGLNLVRITYAGDREYSAWAHATYEQKDFRYWAALVLTDPSTDPLRTVSRLVPDWKERTVAWPKIDGLVRFARGRKQEVAYQTAAPSEVAELDALIARIRERLERIPAANRPSNLLRELAELEKRRTALARRLASERFSPNGLRLFRERIADAVATARTLEWERRCHALLTGAE